MVLLAPLHAAIQSATQSEGTRVRAHHAIAKLEERLITRRCSHSHALNVGAARALKSFYRRYGGH